MKGIAMLSDLIGNLSGVFETVVPEVASDVV